MATPKRRYHLREIMGKLKLTVNEDKTRICTVPEGEFDFLGLRRWLNGNHHKPCHAHRDPRLGFGVRRSVDHDQIRRTDPIVDPSLEMI